MTEYSIGSVNGRSVPFSLSHRDEIDLRACPPLVDAVLNVPLSLDDVVALVWESTNNGQPMEQSIAELTQGTRHLESALLEMLADSGGSNIAQLRSKAARSAREGTQSAWLSTIRQRVWELYGCPAADQSPSTSRPCSMA